MKCQNVSKCLHIKNMCIDIGKCTKKKLNILFYLLADADFELILLPIADVVVANKELL